MWSRSQNNKFSNKSALKDIAFLLPVIFVTLLESENVLSQLTKVFYVFLYEHIIKLSTKVQITNKEITSLKTSHFCRFFILQIESFEFPALLCRVLRGSEESLRTSWSSDGKPPP